MGIEPVFIDTVDGVVLEGEVSLAADRSACVVLAHPHPQYGGDMYSTVTAALFDALPALGVSALRFNFRGVGRSGGEHDEGRGERLDVAAAVDMMAPLADGVPLVSVGWSFGADVSLCVGHPRIDGWLAVAPPLRVADEGAMVAAADPRPVVLAVPEHDQYNPPSRAEPAVESWTNTRIEVVPGADHFLAGRTGRVVELCAEVCRQLAG